MTSNEKLVAAYGTFVVNDTNQANKDFAGFEISEDTVIDSLTEHGATTNVKSEYISTPATAVKPTTIMARSGKYFTGIKLTSGSVNLILSDKK